MSLCVIFNDTSLPFTSLDTCQQKVPLFFSILRKAIKNEIHIIRTDSEVGSNWYNFHYADGFSLSQWIDQQQDRDYKRYIKNIMDKTECPLISSDEIEVLEILANSDFTLADGNQQSVDSLGAALLLDTSAVSFCSFPHWEKNSIAVVHNQLDEQSGDLIKRDCLVDNISLCEHLFPFLQKIKEERRQSRDYLKGLSPTGNRDYTNLIFCPGALRNFVHLGIHRSLLTKIENVLEKLDSIIDYTNNDNDLIQSSMLNISCESQSTKNNRKLIKHRNFKLPDGSIKIFDLHVKNFPNGQRLYFLPDFNSKKIYIGYFGKHLPI